MMWGGEKKLVQKGILFPSSFSKIFWPNDDRRNINVPILPRLCRSPKIPPRRGREGRDAQRALRITRGVCWRVGVVESPGVASAGGGYR